MNIKEMKLSNAWYDALKWIALCFLPAIGALYSWLAPIWGWPYSEEIPETILGIEVFLGTILGVSTAQYNKDNK